MRWIMHQVLRIIQWSYSLPWVGSKIQYGWKIILGDRDLSELIKGSGIAFVFKLLSLPLGLATSLIISRWYGAQAMGIYGLLITILGLVMSFGMMGIGSALQRLLGETRAVKLDKNSTFANGAISSQDESCTEQGVYNTSLLLISLSGFVFSFGLYFGAEWLSLEVFNEVRLIFALQISSFFVLPLMRKSLNESFLLASKNIYYAELVSKVIVPLGMITIVFFSYWIWPTYYIPVWSFLLAATIGTIVTFAILLRKVFRSLRPIFYSRRGILRISWPMLLTGIAFIIVVHTDLFMLGFLTDTASVGIYKVVVGLSTFVAFLLSVLSAFLTPQLTEKIWLKDNFASQKIVNLANLSSSLAAILIAILLIVFRIPILNLFGEGFSLGGGALIILVIYQCINVFTGFGGIILNYGGNEKLYRNILLICSGINIILNYFLISSRGIAGAALATAVSFNIANVFVAYYCIKKTGIYPYFTLLHNHD